MLSSWFRAISDYINTPRIAYRPRVGEVFSVTIEFSEWSKEDRLAMQDALLALSRDTFSAGMTREICDINKYDQDGKAQFWFCMNADGDVNLVGYNLIPRTRYFDPETQQTHYFAKLGPTAIDAQYANRGVARKSVLKILVQLFLMRLFDHAKTAFHEIKQGRPLQALKQVWFMLMSPGYIRLLCNPGNQGIKNQITRMPNSFYTSYETIQQQIVVLNELLRNATSQIEHSLTFLNEINHLLKRKVGLLEKLHDATTEENRQLLLAYPGMYSTQSTVHSTKIGEHFESVWRPKHGDTQPCPTVNRWDLQTLWFYVSDVFRATRKNAHFANKVTPSTSPASTDTCEEFEPASTKLTRPVLGVQPHYPKSHEISIMQWIGSTRAASFFGAIGNVFGAARVLPNQDACTSGHSSPSPRLC